ncbi:pyruvate/ketoisovalerate oxidoreductase gamma subunit [Acidaminococcus sp. CAG:917]|nr:pyruvate/ketoisovalerate oxidoreductase gamma subunit [Acidaminococcus sp. CAG:917]
MERLIVAGFGGQGVLSLGQIIAYASMYENKNVTWLPSYGPEMRGGTANCSVVVDDNPIASPVIATPDTLIAMNKPSLDKFIDKVKSGGLVLVNSSLISEKVKREDVTVVYVDANAVAHKVGNDKASNLVVLGAYIKYSNLFPKEVMLSTIEKVFASKPKFIESNKACFMAGYEH